MTAEPDVVESRLSEDWEFILLACDGIWDVMSNQQVCDFIIKRLALNIQPENICEELMDRSVITIKISTNRVTQPPLKFVEFVELKEFETARLEHGGGGVVVGVQSSVLSTFVHLIHLKKNYFLEVKWP